MALNPTDAERIRSIGNRLVVLRAECDELNRELLVLERAALPDINEIKILVAGYYGFTPLDLESRNRPQKLCFARHVAMYMTRRLTPHSYPVIGRAYDRDHSSVIHGYALIQNRARRSTDFARSIDATEARLVRDLDSHPCG